jgi:hypothetical protein
MSNVLKSFLGQIARPASSSLYPTGGVLGNEALAQMILHQIQANLQIQQAQQTNALNSAAA